MALVLLLVLLAATPTALADGGEGRQAPRVRGIPLSRAPLYDAGKAQFTCLDGKKTVKFSAVNDDYCDCDDGSDEPGTSACGNGKFYCVNLGHRSEYVPSSRVNDMICDCCDGSDEWSGQIACANTCDELGRESRERAGKLAEEIKAGHGVREQLRKDAAASFEEAKTKLAELEKEQEELKPKHQELDDIKKEAEVREKEAKESHAKMWQDMKAQRSRERAEKAFETLDANADKLITLDEIQLRLDFDHDLDGNVSEQEAKDTLQGADSTDVENFVDKIWPTAKIYYRETGVTEAPTPPGESAPVTQEPVRMTTPATPDAERDEEDDELDEPVDDDEVADFDADDYMKRGEVEDAATAQSAEDAEPEPEYDADTQNVVDEAVKARNDFDHVDRRFREIEREITSFTSVTGADWGESHEWLALRTKCYEYKDNQYTYRLCLFDRATQGNLNGGGETNLGVWGEWADEEKRSMRYKDGTGCWNGPNRSTVVTMVCSADTALLSASEPARCEYAFELGTPLACDLADVDALAATERGEHVEL